MDEPVKLQLVAALRERLAVIADEESRLDTNRHMARLQEVSERIERLAAQLPAGADPQLRHFLQRCSYGKALELMQSSPGFADG
ncbi:MAG: hypothetical protein ABI946_06755 [Chthoniobacterales bacterium]